MGRSLQRIALYCVFLFVAHRASADALRTVALSGQAAPGANPGENFGPFVYTDQFYGMTLNDSGRVAFYNNFTNLGLINDRGLWGEGAGSLRLIARATTPAAGSDPGILVAFVLRAPILNDHGESAFHGVANHPSPGDQFAIWTNLGPGNTQLIAQEDEPAPGTTGSFGDLITTIHFNNEGHLAFTAYLDGTGGEIGTRHGVWSSGHGAGLELIAFSGDPAPGTGPGVVFGTADPFPPQGTVFQLAALNDHGNTAFVAEVLGSSTNSFGIWSEQNGGGLSLVALSGDPAPSAGDNVAFYAFGQLRFNNNDRTAFVAGLSGSGVTSGAGPSVWKQTSNGLEMAVRGGDQASGTEPTATHANFTKLAFNDQDHVAFIGTLSGSAITGQNNSAIWREDENGLELVAREGASAPGTTALFGHLGGSDPRPFNYFVLNNQGRIAFSSQLLGTGVDSSNDFGIWAEDADGFLTLVVREGDFIDVDDSPVTSDMRQVAELGFFTKPDRGGGEGTLFNNRGQIAFTARFTDGTSGIFVSNLVAVPEPATVTLSLMVALVQSFLFARSRPSKSRGTALFAALC